MPPPRPYASWANPLRGHSGTLAQARGFCLARPSLSGCNPPHGSTGLRSNTRACEQAEGTQLASHGAREIVARADEQLRPTLPDRSVLRSGARTQPLVDPVGLGSVPGALRAGSHHPSSSSRARSEVPQHAATAEARACGRMVATDDDYMASHPRARPAIGGARAFMRAHPSHSLASRAGRKLARPGSNHPAATSGRRGAEARKTDRSRCRALEAARPRPRMTRRAAAGVRAAYAQTS
jgi:hypothetical protein